MNYTVRELLLLDAEFWMAIELDSGYGTGSLVLPHMDILEKIYRDWGIPLNEAGEADIAWAALLIREAM